MRNRLSAVLMILFVGLFFLSCADQDYISSADSSVPELTPGGKLRIPVRLLVSGLDLVETRSTDKEDPEKKLHSIGVLVFEAASEGGLTDQDRLIETNFVDLEKLYGPGLNDKAYIELSPRSEKCYLQVYANLSAEARGRLESLTSSGSSVRWINIKDFKLTLGELYKDPLQPGGEYSNLSDDYPMSSRAVFLQDISVASTNNLEIPLYMSAARIDITAAGLTNFTLNKVKVMDGEPEGFLWYQPNRSFSGKRTGSFRSTPVTSAGVVSPVYIYPTSFMPEADPDQQATDLILNGNYTDASGTQHKSCYYKVRMYYPQSNETRYVINPNTLYRVRIKEISGPGYLSLDEAKANKPLNIKYDVTIDNSANGATDLVISNGAYYLGVTNSDYMVYTDQTRYNLFVTNLSHNAPKSVTTATVELKGDGLTLRAESFMTVSGNTGVLDQSDGTDKQYPLHIHMDASRFTTASEGSLTIRIGDLIKTLRIKRKNGIAGGLHIETGFADGRFVRAEFAHDEAWSWVKFADQPGYKQAAYQKSIDSPGGNIYCYFLLNNTHNERFSSFYFSKNNTEGRLKADFFQPPVPPVTPDIWSITLLSYTMDAHYDFRPLTIRAKKGRSSIEIRDNNYNPIQGVSAYNWVRLSDALQYPGVNSGRLQTKMADINHNSGQAADGYNETTTMLYADEYINLAANAPRNRSGYLKFCHTVYDDPELLNSDETLSFIPVYTYFDQYNIVNLGYFGGDFSTETGYTKRLGIENMEENLIRYFASDKFLNPVPWGVSGIHQNSLADGKSNTWQLYQANGPLPLPANSMDMIRKTYAAAYCMYKNRDIDGNGKIEGEEVKWYLPARNNMIGVNIFYNSDLFLGKPDNSKSYYTSSLQTLGGADYILYNHFTVHYNDQTTINGYAERIRCVRNLD